MATLDGAEVVCLGKCEGSYVVRMSSSVGRRLPAHAAALGVQCIAVPVREHSGGVYLGLSLSGLWRARSESWNG